MMQFGLLFKLQLLSLKMTKLYFLLTHPVEVSLSMLLEVSSLYMGTKYTKRASNWYWTCLYLTIVLKGQVKKSIRHGPLVVPLVKQELGDLLWCRGRVWAGAVGTHRGRMGKRIDTVVCPVFLLWGEPKEMPHVTQAPTFRWRCEPSHPLSALSVPWGWLSCVPGAG